MLGHLLLTSNTALLLRNTPATPSQIEQKRQPSSSPPTPMVPSALLLTCNAGGPFHPHTYLQRRRQLWQTRPFLFTSTPAATVVDPSGGHFRPPTHLQQPAATAVDLPPFSSPTIPVGHHLQPPPLATSTKTSLPPPPLLPSSPSVVKKDISGCGRFQKQGICNEDNLKVMFEDITSDATDHWCPTMGNLPRPATAETSIVNLEDEDDDDIDEIDLDESPTSARGKRSARVVDDKSKKPKTSQVMQDEIKKIGVLAERTQSSLESFTKKDETCSINIVMYLVIECGATFYRVICEKRAKGDVPSHANSENSF